MYVEFVDCECKVFLFGFFHWNYTHIQTERAEAINDKGRLCAAAQPLSEEMWWEEATRTIATAC